MNGLYLGISKLLKLNLDFEVFDVSMSKYYVNRISMVCILTIEVLFTKYFFYISGRTYM